MALSSIYCLIVYVPEANCKEVTALRVGENIAQEQSALSLSLQFTFLPLPPYHAYLNEKHQVP